jgi:hypothetical protein
VTVRVRRVRAVVAGIAWIGLATSAQALPVNQIPPAGLTGTTVIDFETLPGGFVNRDSVLSFPDASFGERFDGQTVVMVLNFDGLSGSPTSPLALLAGDPNDNLTTVETFGDVVLYGNSHFGYPFFSAIGEGAVSVLYAIDQSQVGFQLEGAEGGPGTIQFFRRDGTLISTVTLPFVNGALAFERDLGIADIAGISITNTDSGGVGFDDFVVQPIPEPGTAALVGAGTLLMAGWRLRKRVPTS